jgi:hypothetical protein
MIFLRTIVRLEARNPRSKLIELEALFTTAFSPTAFEIDSPCGVRQRPRPSSTMAEKT